MKQAMLEWVLKIAAMVFIFLMPIVYLVDEFSNETVVESTENSMPVLILIIITLLFMVGVSWLFSQTMNAIKDSPFGYGSLLFFGGLMLAVAIISTLWLGKVQDLIEINASQFLSDLDVYRGAVNRILLYIAIGLGLSASGFVVRLNRK